MNDSSRTVSVHEALIYAMVTLSAADTRMTDREIAKIGDIVRGMPIFSDFHKEGLIPAAEACGVILQQDDGLDRVLGIISTALPKRLYETAYALAVEVTAADLHAEQEELRFLQMLRDRLDLDPLTTAAIERSARVRYRTL